MKLTISGAVLQLLPNDSPNGGLRKPEKTSQVVLGIGFRFVKLLDRFDNVFRHFLSVVVFERGATVSPSFLYHVLHVLLMRSKKKVVGPDAGRVIAMVAYEKPIRDRPIVNEPGNSVCPHSPSVRPSTTHQTVTVDRLMISGPKPTRLGFLYFRPEPLNGSGIKLLRGIRSLDTVNLHNKFVLLCRAPGCSYSAGAFRFNPIN